VDISSDSKNEEACVQYDLRQNTDNENLFILHEVWKNDEGLDLHNKQSYLLEFVRKTDLFLEEKPTIYRTTSRIR
jgi:quinol monooxygenase YgiN